MKLNALQIETIIDSIVPLISAKEDHDFFKGMLHIVADNSSSAQFSVFIKKLLDNTSNNNIGD